jgi:hypothetical protein
MNNDEQRRTRRLELVAAALAPRAFLLTAGERDPLIPSDGLRAIAAAARRQYAVAGAPARFEAILFPSGHRFPDEVKVGAYAFLDRWLT